MKKNYLSLALSKTTRKIIPRVKLSSPLLSTIEVKKILLTQGFQTRSILLIQRNQQFVWLVRGVYQHKPSFLTIDFYANRIRLHKSSPNWKIACPHSPIIIRKQPYHINEAGADIFLVKDSQ